MKKSILTVAVIAVAFAGLAFMPVQKNNAMEEAVITTGEKDKQPSCDYKYKTEKDFSECETKHGPLVPQGEEVDVLDKY